MIHLHMPPAAWPAPSLVLTLPLHFNSDACSCGCVSSLHQDTATEPRRWLSLQDASLLSLLSLMESMFSMPQPLCALNRDFEEGYLTSKCNVPRPAPRVDSNSRSLGSLQ